VALDVGELVAHLRVGAEGMARGLRDGESRFRKFGDKLTTLAAGAGLAAAAAFGAAILANMNQEAVGAKIAAQLGQSSEEAAEYGALAGKLYAENWGESVEAIGDTIKEVALAQISPDETNAALEDTARRAQILADVFGADVKGSVEAVQQMIRNGLVPTAQEGFDLIAAGMQGGVDKAEDLNDTFVEYSTQFREMGLNGYQAMGLMSQALHAGARDADTAADAIKEFAIRAKDGSTTSAEGFKAIGLDAKKMTAIFNQGGEGAAQGLDTVLTKLKAMKDPTAQEAAAVALFGTKAEDLGNALYAMDLDTASAEFDGAAGSIDRAGEALSNTDSAKIESFKREMMAAAQAIAADFVPSLSEAGGWIKDNEAWLKPLAVTLLSVAAAIVAVNLATKAWMATEKAFTAIKAAGTAMQWLFNAALWASPITWIVIGIIALIAVIVLIATKTDWFQKAWKWAWSGIKAGAMAVWGWIKGTLWPGMKVVFDGIAAVAMWLWKSVMVPTWEGIQTIIGMAWRIISSTAALIAWAWTELVGRPALAMWNDFIKPAFDAIGAAAVWLWQNVLLPAWNGIKAGFEVIGDAAMWLWEKAIMPAWNGIAAAASWLWKTVLEPAWNGIKSGVETVGDVIKKVFDKVGGWIAAGFSGAAGIVKGAMNGVISVINGAISGINWVIDTANKVPGVNFPKIGSIPKLAGGGAVMPNGSRGTPVIMGDGGEVEYGIPKSDMRQIIADAVRAGAGAGGGGAITISADKNEFFRWLRAEIGLKGGNVQKVLGS
jgi:hypothetical protein